MLAELLDTYCCCFFFSAGNIPGVAKGRAALYADKFPAGVGAEINHGAGQLAPGVPDDGRWAVLTANNNVAGCAADNALAVTDIGVNAIDFTRECHRAALNFIAWRAYGV